MNIVRLEGSSHYEIGYMHGEKLKKEIQEMEKYLPDFLIKTRGKVMGIIAYKVLVNRAKVMKKYILKDYQAEIMGVAKGAGVDPNFILLINVFDELKNCLGCSAIAVGGLYGVNTDYVVFGDFLGSRNTVFIYPNFVSVSWPGYIGVIRGMNDQGTVLISLASYSKDQRLRGTPTSLLYREIIEKFDIVAPLIVGRRTIGNNILLRHKYEGPLVLEVSANHLEIRQPEKFITATNHYQADAMKKYQRPPKPAKGSKMPLDQFWNFFGLEGSKKRDAILQEEIKNSKQITPERIKNILAKVANKYTTLNTVIFDPINLIVYVADNNGKMPATDGKLVKINLNSCQYIDKSFYWVL